MKKAVVKLIIEDVTVTFDCDNMGQVTMKNLVDCLQVFVGVMKELGGTDLLIMASVISGICQED